MREGEEMGRFDGVMILTDMDGTLLDSQSRLSPENRRAILRFIQQGGRFSVATGRVKQIGRASCRERV